MEAMPALPAPAAPAPPHLVLVDELPFRGEARSHERSEHEHRRHGKKRGRHGRPYHPAPGIVVDVLDATGATSAAELQRTARSSGYWAFRRCYEEGLRRDQHLAGHVALDVSLAAGAEHATITSATLRDESVVLCVAREAAHLALAGTDSVGTARMDVALSTGDEPVPVPRLAPHADEIREALRGSWPAVRQCYAGELARHPDAGGRLELRFRLQGDEGADVAEGESRLAYPDLARCVLGVYRGARLPAFGRGSHETSFVYAVHLEARPDQNVSPAAK
jgi:hypothetical protein